MPENRLKYETSPYLLQHKDNPVHWWAWGPEALAEAKSSGKPILLSVGYAACHWCHVMAHESFEDEATARVMNERFVNIKVDREERPDIDAIYMGALQHTGEPGGWPLTMFLDVDGRPFWGGTYFPKEASFGRPAFITVLVRVSEAFRAEPEAVRQNGKKLISALEDRDETQASEGPTPEGIRDLVTAITRSIDLERGGLKGAPKFPHWSIFWLLWRGAMRFEHKAAEHAVITTLIHMCQGGIYDHLGGGFARYSVDERWLVPHFEKMLYDNALLVDLMTEAWRETQEPILAQRIAETVRWLSREMIAEGGGFASSLDADSEGHEGQFYIWDMEQITRVLGHEDASFFCLVYGATPAGNFEGANILNRLDSLSLLSPAEEERLGHLRRKLFAEREKRVRPARDDKILADWNGLMIASLARAATVFNQPQWLTLCRQAFGCISERLDAGDDRLFHAFRCGQARAPATASDYAYMVWAALRMFEATSEPIYLERCQAWTRTLERHYWDQERGGYFTSADDTNDVIVRLKPSRDDAVPNANAIQFSNLLMLAALTGNITYEVKAETILKAFSVPLAENPVAHCGLLAASLDAGSLIQIVLAGVDVEPLRAILNCLSLPQSLELRAPMSDLGSLPTSLHYKVDSSENSKCYICVGAACGDPISAPEALADQLRQARTAKFTDEANLLPR